MSKSRRHGIFAVDSVVPRSQYSEKELRSKQWTPINYCLQTVFKQMELAGNRPRTIHSYDYIFKQFCEANNIIFAEEITAEAIYNYLDVMEVSDRTKKIRLKTVKAVLGKFYFNNWLKERFWHNIHIKTDTEVKVSAKESDIYKLFHYIDQSNFIGFRDVTAIQLMFKTGIRISTVCHLRERHVDLENGYLNLDGSTLKNHNFLKLPIDEELAERLRMLIELNKKIRNHYNRHNSHIFITQLGLNMDVSKSSNCAISKQLSKYSKRFNLPNINAHAIRRAYAKSLLEKGASVPLISKALGHSDLAVTTQYLDLNTDEVANSLKEFL